MHSRDELVRKLARMLYERLNPPPPPTQEKKMIRVKRDEANALFEEIGFRKPQQWSDQKMQDHVEGLKETVEEEGDDFPAIKKHKELFDKIITAIEEEEEIDVLPLEEVAPEEDDKDEDDDEDDDDEEEDEDDAEPTAGDDDEDDDAEEPEEEDDDEDDAEPQLETTRRRRPPAKQPQRTAPEEFVGTRELIAKLDRLVAAVLLLTNSLAPGKGGRRSNPEPSTNSASNGNGNGKSKVADVIAEINSIFEDENATTIEKALKVKTVVKKLAAKFPSWTEGELKKRLLSRLNRREMHAKKTRDGRYYVTAK
jgi:hypothetical protein